MIMYKHTRSNEIIHVEPKDVIIIEGILVLEDERLRDLMDIKLFVDTDSDFVLFVVFSVILKSVAVQRILLSSNT